MKPLNILPWPVVNGERVTTCGYEENALGLTPLIAGWCHEGFYVARGIRPGHLQRHIDSIDWKRVVEVKSKIDIYTPFMGVSVTPDPIVYVKYPKYEMAYRACFKSVSETAFNNTLNHILRGRKAKTMIG